MDLEMPARYFATTLYDRYQQQSLSFVFLPARSLRNGVVPAWDQISRTFGPTSKEIPATHLPLALASLLSPAGSTPPFSWIDQLASGASISVDPNKLGFAEYVAFSEVIPFEESPLKGKAPLAIAATAGAHLGFIIGAAHPPLLLITVPSGILLCTAAAIIGPSVGRLVTGLLGVSAT